MPRRQGDAFEGACPFHGACVEGMVASGSIAKRLGVSNKKLQELPDDHEVWDTISFYLAHLCVTLTLVASPQVIVLGGGLMNREKLFPLIRTHTVQLLNGYVKSPKILEHVERYIVASRFGGSSGLIGALCVAARAHSTK